MRPPVPSGRRFSASADLSAPPLCPCSLFFGKARQAITFGADTKPSAEHDQDVLFNHLLLNVGDTGTSKDLHDSLADYYTPESVEIAGKPALMREVPVKYPALLHLQLQVRPPPNFARARGAFGRDS